jgi:hypothetical protein
MTSVWWGKRLWTSALSVSIILALLQLPLLVTSETENQSRLSSEGTGSPCYFEDEEGNANLTMPQVQFIHSFKSNVRHPQHLVQDAATFFVDKCQPDVLHMTFSSKAASQLARSNVQRR